MKDLEQIEEFEAQLEGEPEEKPTPEPADKSEKGEKSGKDKEPETVSLTKAEYESLKRERDEARESERAWAEMVRKPEPKAEEKPKRKAEPVEDDSPEKLVEEFTKQGVKALNKRGVPTMEEIEERIKERAEEIAGQIVDQRLRDKEARELLKGELADLNDKRSPLFKETKKRMEDLTRLDPSAATSYAAMIATARHVKAELDAKKPKQEEEDRYEYDEPARKLRAESQGGVSRRRQDEESSLSAEQLHVMKAMGMDEKEYREGEKISSINRRRA